MSSSSDKRKRSVSPQTSQLKRYELLYYKQVQADAKIERAKQDRMGRELDECTFKPVTNTRYPNNMHDRKVYEKMAMKAGTLFSDLQKKIRKEQSSLMDQQNQEKELQECTFKPKINKGIGARK